MSGELIILLSAIIVVFAIIALTVWAVLTKHYEDGKSLEQIQWLSDKAAQLVETSELYKQMGMEQEAHDAAVEAERLNTMVWDVINGASL